MVDGSTVGVVVGRDGYCVGKFDGNSEGTVEGTADGRGTVGTLRVGKTVGFRLVTTGC